MRIKVVQKPTLYEVDGLRLDTFEPGVEYDVGTTLGTLLLAEGWAEPLPTDEPPVAIVFGEVTHDSRTTVMPANVVREISPPYYDAPPALAADRRRVRRSRVKPQS